MYLNRSPQVKAAHPGLPISEITKILGEMWAKADPEEKAACDAVVQADRARYEREMATYVKPSPTAGIAAAAIAQVREHVMCCTICIVCRTHINLI